MEDVNGAINSERPHVGDKLRKRRKWEKFEHFVALVFALHVAEQAWNIAVVAAALVQLFQNGHLVVKCHVAVRGKFHHFDGDWFERLHVAPKADDAAQSIQPSYSPANAIRPVRASAEAAFKLDAN